ncbi:MAG: hypothetical protein ACI8X5_002379 [Planctomycetota bacterium]|jgi:hypothetical protein
MALRADGSIVSWGDDDWGNIGSTPSGTGFTQISGGAIFTIALRADGSIKTWRYPSEDPGGTGFTKVMAGGGAFLMALRADNAGTAYCAGDGSGEVCPCESNGNAGEGCANSGGLGGVRLSATGNAYLLADTLQLEVNGAPGNVPGLLFQGMNQLNAGLGNPLGDGLLCTSGQVLRSQVQVTSAGSTLFSNFQGSGFGAASYGAGVQTNYQFWYRDAQGTCSGSEFNLSNAWAVTWIH